MDRISNTLGVEVATRLDHQMMIETPSPGIYWHKLIVRVVIDFPDLNMHPKSCPAALLEMLVGWQGSPSVINSAPSLVCLIKGVLLEKEDDNRLAFK